MRLSCSLAAGALAVAAVPSCAFHVTGPATVPTSAKTSFTSSTSAISGRYAAATAPVRNSNRNVLQASLNVPGSNWVRSRAERAKSALVLDASADATAPAKKTSTLKVGFYLFVWYSLTIGYNIYNKATLNRMNIPWILSTVQLAVGTVYVSLIWALGVRKAPKLSGDNLKAVLPLAALHTTSHIAAVVGLSAGAIGFVQIVKVRKKGERTLNIYVGRVAMTCIQQGRAACLHSTAVCARCSQSLLCCCCAARDKTKLERPACVYLVSISGINKKKTQKKMHNSNFVVVRTLSAALSLCVRALFTFLFFSKLLLLYFNRSRSVALFSRQIDSKQTASRHQTTHSRRITKYSHLSLEPVALLQAPILCFPCSARVLYFYSSKLLPL